MTPDGDEYVEAIDCSSSDDGPEKAKLLNAKGSTPFGLAGRFYRFSEVFDDEVLKDHILRARSEVEKELGKKPVDPMEVRNEAGELVDFDAFCGLARRKKSAAVAKAKSSVASPKAKAKSATKASGKQPATGGGTAVEAAGEEADSDDETPEDAVWVSLEKVDEEVEIGQELEVVSSDLVLGSRAVHTLPSGKRVFARRVSVTEAAAGTAGLAKGTASSDARIMSPLTFDIRGRRWLDFSAGVNQTREEKLEDFPLNGDRSLTWLLRYIKEHGGTPDGRQTKWATEQRIERDSVAYAVHDLAGLALELAVCYDQVDAPNLACLEVVGRLYQLVEETNGSMKIEGFDHYIGRDKSAGLRRGIALAPGLASYTTTQLGKETDILKQRRKAREEEAALKAAKKGR